MPFAVNVMLNLSNTLDWPLCIEIRYIKIFGTNSGCASEASGKIVFLLSHASFVFWLGHTPRVKGLLEMTVPVTQYAILQLCLVTWPMTASEAGVTLL